MRLLISVFLLAVTAVAFAAGEDTRELRPVPVIQDGWLDVSSSAGQGRVPVHATLDWSLAQPQIQRAVIFIHGQLRSDLHSGERSIRMASSASQNTISITPQFLIAEDVAAHQLPDSTLRWGVNDWKTGFNAKAPAPISSFAVVDTIIEHLLDHKIFPNLELIVLAGHSAGGQYVQRYALLGQGSNLIDKGGVKVRYVVANTSSYAYSDDMRPTADGRFAPFDAGKCDRVSRWPYGMNANLPAYVRKPVSPQAMTKEFLQRDVIYLLGEEDKDPNHPDLDKTCAGEAQGESRLVRGRFYFAYAAQFDPGHRMNQRLFLVPGVGHGADGMYSSSCGLAALYEEGVCSTASAAR